ncbi:uncharacterized protein LOC104236095 [Trichonephila clavipes]|nr:uncharacterized protein LOC104236095 [Trichonephila clavipes]
MFLERHAAGCIPLNGRKEDCHSTYFGLVNQQLRQIKLIKSSQQKYQIGTLIQTYSTSSPKNMIHGPCGAFNNNSSCMSDGKCTKRYPRENWFLILSLAMTDIHCIVDDQLRMVGKSVVLKVRNIDIEVDNRWIVPYSPLLSMTFKAHINVEYCNSVKSIKYICKYVNKGSDMAVFGVGNVAAPLDEINQYQLERYISSNEAVWRILSFQSMNDIQQ